jgi:hypothetical protein
MLNLEEVRKLVTALEQDLAKAESGSADVQALKDEVEALRKALHSSEPGHGWVREALERIHARIDAVAETAKTDAAIAGPYIAAIGRILGLS